MLLRRLLQKALHVEWSAIILNSFHRNTIPIQIWPLAVFFFNYVLQLIFSIFRNKSYTYPFNSSTEGTLFKCLVHTAHNAHHCKDVDALKFQLVRRDAF